VVNLFSEVSVFSELWIISETVAPSEWKFLKLSEAMAIRKKMMINDGIRILSFKEPRKENCGGIFLVIFSKLRLQDLIYFHTVNGNYNRFPRYYINSFQ